MSAIKDNEIRLKMIEDVKKYTEGKLEAELIDKTIKEITSLGIEGYQATVSYVGKFIKQIFNIVVEDHHEVFRGESWGISSIGVGASEGWIWTDNLDKLFSDTTHFKFVGNSLVLGITFQSADLSPLGVFTGLGISLVTGIGSGSGNWS
ncbi:VapA/VapB family virulence-associated protein [Xenorhabdus sp. KK7.4]|uniref:VapA/VapB family virulence-associated protein n=1 Tax=Xenorhabdus sp. KK7.4 TaxID=1851572 RepID=UPI000C044DB1|nr:VapA/VapB family virulence-associated protein [Xenorhabdus sp. KK7.4]PHM58993.1 hypothetical protein Xekk_00832 [Xenorhabdus sp. KK7.4]